MLEAQKTLTHNIKKKKNLENEKLIEKTREIIFFTKVFGVINRAKCINK